jgi:hypothetical protein
MRWSWVADLIVPALSALAETMWLYAFVLVLTPPDDTHPGFVAVGGLIIGGSLAGRTVGRLPWPYLRSLLVLAPVSMIVLTAWILTAAESSYLAGAAGVALWCRGVWLGAVPTTSETLVQRFLVGAITFVSLAILFLLGRGTGIERFANTTEGLVVGYFIFGPGTIALANVQTLHGQRSSRPASLTWAGALVVPMAIIVATGLLLSTSVAPMVGHLLHRLIQATLGVLQSAAWLLHGLLAALRWLTVLLSFGPERRAPADDAAPWTPPPWLKSAEASVAEGQDMFWPAVAAACLLLLFAFFLMRRAGVGSQEERDEERSSVWSWHLFLHQLSAAWQSMRDRHGARSDARPGAGQTQSSIPQMIPDPTDMRAVYRMFLRWAAVHGHARRPATTPREFHHQLVDAAPHLRNALSLITENYESSRYGDDDLSEATVAASAAAIRALSEMAIGSPTPLDKTA